MGLCETCQLEPNCHRVWKSTRAKIVNCVSYTKQKTRAEEIRSMTDEQMAQWLYCIASERGEWSLKHWLDWLREEAKA